VPTIQRRGERDNRVIVSARVEGQCELERERLRTAALAPSDNMQDPHELILPCGEHRGERLPRGNSVARARVICFGSIDRCQEVRRRRGRREQCACSVPGGGP
jgi:hypothetical protein